MTAVLQLLKVKTHSLLVPWQVCGQPALLFAAQHGHRMACELLLAHGADPDVRTPVRWLHSRCACCVERLAHSLCECVLPRQSAQWTPLHAAAERGDMVVLTMLLNSGNADVNAADVVRVAAVLPPGRALSRAHDHAVAPGAGRLDAAPRGSLRGIRARVLSVGAPRRNSAPAQQGTGHSAQRACCSSRWAPLTLAPPVSAYRPGSRQHTWLGCGATTPRTASSAPWVGSSRRGCVRPPLREITPLLKRCLVPACGLTLPTQR